MPMDLIGLDESDSVGISNFFDNILVIIFHPHMRQGCRPTKALAVFEMD
eukprot:CAMPEP_0202448252 /NCGR_PEP_ID=MMETSP1360-20130828/7077_1 /ASSEMBLY_ACC=CAM_ASM_000848 /TAXON_ID=515479 /ORGANISM="Licmophora paradoxa, Strain CCMP2313" /LENGTH=48 /DNA_ID= /DNA_START= /DNA_END= /DNA_ORIENTATION=